MNKSTALILSGFIKSMKEDAVGWNDEVIGEVAYQIYRLIENPLDIPQDKIRSKKK